MSDLDTLVSAFFWPDEFDATLRRTLARLAEGTPYPSFYIDAIRHQYAIRLAHESRVIMKTLIQQVIDGLDSQK